MKYEWVAGPRKGDGNKDRPYRSRKIDDQMYIINRLCEGVRVSPVSGLRQDKKEKRYRLALFDILFRSNASGSIAGAPFEISTSSIQNERETAWPAKQVPVVSLGAIPGGSLSWFTAGYLDVRVDDQWQRADSLRLDMDWRLQIENVELNASPGAGALARIDSS